MSGIGLENFPFVGLQHESYYRSEMEKQLKAKYNPLATEVRTLAELNVDNHGKITLVRTGESLILHVARSQDESFIQWLAEAVGAAAYGVYSHPRDVSIGLTWG